MYGVPTANIPCGPPWIESMSGYFFRGSKFGGLMIQPCTLSPSTDGYQISSTAPNVFPSSTSPLTSVRRRTAPALRSIAATSLGIVADESVPAATPDGDMLVISTKWLPVVTALAGPPFTDANQTFSVPRSCALKYTPLASLAQM